MKNPPALSVCIPVYNPKGLLGACLQSIFEQTIQDFELIIVDDASTQPVLPELAPFPAERIRFIRNERNLGLVGNWNRCLELAKGDYITLFHQDDVMCPRNLEMKVQALEQDENVGVAYSDIRRIDGSGRVFGGHHLPQPEHDCTLTGPDLYGEIAKYGNPVSCPSVVFRRACIETAGDFDPRFAFATDLNMWMRMGLHYAFRFIKEPLILYRVHDQQETHKWQVSGRDYEDVFGVYNEIYSRSLPDAFMAHARPTFLTLSKQAWAMARWMLRLGRPRVAYRYLSVAARSMRMANRRDFRAAAR